MKAPESAHLDRIQIIKLWSDGYMEYEKIYNVAVSAGRTVDPETGAVEPVPNTVDVSSATYSNEHGAPELHALWTDPDFVPGQDAVYYARVLELPTPRWSTYDAVKWGCPIRQSASDYSGTGMDVPDMRQPASDDPEGKTQTVQWSLRS